MPFASDELFLSFQAALAGRYSLDRELGRGGMGVVYLAREVHLDRSVAIKLLPPERAAQRTLRDRFLREARLAAKLSHPNIIPIFSVEETDGFVFFVMAFVDGETLANRVRTRGPVPATDGARILREIAWALAYAHEQGLVHRDVKPDNILLESTSGRVLVADFGIAAAVGDVTDGVLGTPEFMSPEQALGTTLDARSDLYSLGATAFYMFSGKFPFEGKTATEVLAKQVTQSAPSLVTLGLSVPRKMAALIDRCLAKAPDHRPESAKALAEQLGVALELRRAMPAELRAFVNRSARLNGPGTLLALGVLSVAFFIAAGFVVGTSGSAWSVFAAMAVAALSVTAPILALADAAADLIKKGFTHRDIGPAFDSVLDQVREELALERSAERVSMERVLSGMTVASFLMAGSWTIAMLLPDVDQRALGRFLGNTGAVVFNIFAGLGAVIGTFSGIGWVIMRDRRIEPEGSFWARLWKGRVGLLAFAIATKFAKAKGITAITHRATELSLGMAAEQLFESLPKATRNQLGDVPGTLMHLQSAAQELRKRHESLAEALADAGDAGAGPEYADIREMRNSMHDRLREAVGALETIRLNLLRLHAGSIGVESVTTQLGIAADVAAEVERLIAAQGEVDRMLKFPRTPATTPV
ncbi:MAG: serine/threonine-protein kinase [Gemmatimonadota bacterium]